MTRIVKKPDERRSELIACAQKLFYSKGYESTSVRDIVDQVGVAKGTFYYYFDSKQAILEALVAELTAQKHVLFQDIVADETLTTIQKWTRAVQVIGDWKLERKAELIALLRVMQKDENVLLQHKLSTRSAQMAAPILTKIIVQGIAEGVFEPAYVEEAAEIVYAISKAFSDTLAGILLHPDNYDHPAALARRKIAAVQTAIERVLGAKPGSFPIIDEQTLAAWFEDWTLSGKKARIDNKEVNDGKTLENGVA
jgi:AcrR family transcriptional regulator